MPAPFCILFYHDLHPSNEFIKNSRRILYINSYAGIDVHPFPLDSSWNQVYEVRLSICLEIKVYMYGLSTFEFYSQSCVWRYTCIVLPHLDVTNKLSEQPALRKHPKCREISSDPVGHFDWCHLIADESVTMCTAIKKNFEESFGERCFTDVLAP